MESTILDNNPKYTPNLKIPFINLGIAGAIFTFIFWVFFGLSIIFIVFFLIYVLIGFLYILSKLTVNFIVGKDFVIKRNTLTKKDKKIDFSSISHFDLEKGVQIKLKSGGIFTMDNANAVAQLEENLKEFGVNKRTVNMHNKAYSQKH